MLVLRDLVLWGKTRFADLQASDDKIASNIPVLLEIAAWGVSHDPETGA